MSESLQHLIKTYNAFYEVSPYSIVVEEGHGSTTPARHLVQAGFDVDVHGVSKKRDLDLPAPADYALGYTELKKIAEAVSHLMTGCSIEVISFPATVFSDPRRHFQSEAVLRIRISHYGNVADRSGLPEEQALKEIEKQLQDLGLARR